VASLTGNYEIKLTGGWFFDLKLKGVLISNRKLTKRENPPPIFESF